MSTSHQLKCCLGINTNRCGIYKPETGTCEDMVYKMCQNTMDEDSNCRKIYERRNDNAYHKRLADKSLSHYCQSEGNFNKDICACHLPKPRYDKIKENILSQYDSPRIRDQVRASIEGEPGLCFYDRCIDKTSACAGTKVFLTCLQEANANITSQKMSGKISQSQAQNCAVHVGAEKENVKVVQDNEKKKNQQIDIPSEKPSSKPAQMDTNKDSESNQGNFIIIIVFLVSILLCSSISSLVGAIMVSTPNI